MDELYQGISNIRTIIREAAKLLVDHVDYSGKKIDPNVVRGLGQITLSAGVALEDLQYMLEREEEK